MPIVNTQGLPDPVFEAIKNRPYNNGGADISVTGLISPPRVRQLSERLKDSIDVEAADQLYALDGSAMHAILEWAGKTLDPERYILERRLFAEVNGWTISGQIDVIDLEKKLIQDYKKTSYWVAAYGAKDEWTKQLNCYRWLCHANGIDVEHLEVWASFRDWKKDQAQRDKSYPQAGHKLMQIDLWPLGKAKEFVYNRVSAHQEASKLSTNDLPKCTDEEKWNKGHGFAVKLAGAKSARKICDTRSEALLWVDKNIKVADLPKVKIETREGEPRRCINYCQARFHCEYGRGWARK